ncbi:hypothetical protein [Agrilutibacter solisilvae]|uniref:Uncharacterized protein n=1 Tax=Agrilutibacter solisilvae TaxID=2763317 RepID=A0A975AS97_9GAMM|nr:hypothetical protein [Lysobacter solisilvae]QSX78068.1 hypothetical protein I8J32_015375 [Lysobacter solisilvae]
MQNLISITLTDQDLADFDEALATLRRLMAPMVSLQAADRRELSKMGPKSEAFCSQTLAVLANNPGMVPPNLGFPEAQADYKTLQQLRPRFALLRQLAEKSDDSELALGSDLMACCLEGYRLMSGAGQAESLKAARRALSQRFARRAGAGEPEVPQS